MIAAEACTKCGGLGLYKLDVAPDHPDFGRMLLCPGEAHAGERLARMVAQSGLKAHERRYTLDDILGLDGVTEELTAVMRQFVDESCGWLYIWGVPGNGKSLALMAAVNEFVQRGTPALYVTLADLLDLMRETFSKPRRGRTDPEGEDAWREWDTYQQRFKRVQTVKVLAVDEFDSAKINQTGFVTEFRARLIDHRYRDAIGGETVTLFAGNDDPALLPGWIYDRVRDGRFGVWRNTGKSVRQLMEW